MTSEQPSLRYLHELGEWDWFETNKGSVLHQADVRWDEDSGAVGGEGRSACGLHAEFWIPGIFSRMAVPRCKRCCLKIGMPQGIGSPKNDDTCRPLIETRLKMVTW
jgi:hypothetical protein